MWQQLLKMLEAFGRFRVPGWRMRIPVAAGNPEAPDVAGEMAWRGYLSAERLFDTWGPVPGSLWEPFHCVTLFAALDRVVKTGLGPTDPQLAVEIDARVGRLPGAPAPLPGWAGPGVLVFLDLPGAYSVALAARLIEGGMQPVCTFDNWPHPSGLLQPERLLAQLLRYAAKVDACRHLLSPNSPPLWVCDRDRFGARRGRPREFDNRYYLDDSLLPGPELLRQSGIGTVVCVLPSLGERLHDDLHFHFVALQNAGFETLGTSLEEPDLRLSRLELGPRKKPAFREFRRSSAGGFGVLIPEPSSGSGG